MLRWFKSWSLEIDSESKQRTLMKTDLQDIPIEAESVPFSFNTNVLPNNMTQSASARA